MIINKIKWNKTTQFLIDSLELDFGELLKNNLVNAYLCDFKHDVLHKECLYLLFNPLKFTTDFEKFSEKLKQHSGFLEDYDTSGEGKVMFVFKFPNKFKDVITSFIHGKYSEFNPEYVKKYFPQYYAGKLSVRWMIIKKHPEYRKKVHDDINLENTKKPIYLDENAELFSIPELHEEIYNFNQDIYNLWIT